MIDTADLADNYLFVGATNGLWRIDVTTGASTAFGGSPGSVPITGVAAGPSSPSTTLWATVATGAGAGIYKCTAIETAPTCVLQAPGGTSYTTGDLNSPQAVFAQTESSVTALYIVGTPGGSGSGVDRCTPGASPALTCTSVSLPPTTPGTCTWATVVATYNGTTAQSYVGCSYSGGSGDPSDWNPAIYDIPFTGSTAGAPTAYPAADADVKRTIGGSKGPQWWLISNLSNGGSKPYYPYPENTSSAINRLGGDQSVVAQLAFDPAGDLYVAGRSGVWEQASGSANFYPMVQGLDTTIDNAAVTDPNNPAQVADADVDWSTLVSSAHLTDQVALSQPSDTTSTYAMTLDALSNPETLYVGLGQSSGTKPPTGNVCYNTEIWTSPSMWACDPITISGTTLTNKVVGVAVGHPISGKTRIIAMVDGNNTAGVYYANPATGTWTAATQSPATPIIGYNLMDPHAQIWWPNPALNTGDNPVFLYDPSSGLWGSGDGGQSWTQLLMGPTAISNAGNSGYMAGYTMSATQYKIYLSLSKASPTPTVETVVVTDSAGTLSAGSPSSVTLSSCNQVKYAGPVATDANGVPYLAMQPSPYLSTSSTASCTAALLKGTAAGSTTFNRIDSSDAYGANYSAQASFVNQLALGGDGAVYAPTNGDGVEVEAPITRCPQGC